MKQHHRHTFVTITQDPICGLTSMKGISICLCGELET